jgi:hypothetical protein
MSKTIRGGAAICLHSDLFYRTGITEPDRWFPLRILRRPRESGGPGRQTGFWLLWVPAFAGMTPEGIGE